MPPLILPSGHDRATPARPRSRLQPAAPAASVYAPPPPPPQLPQSTHPYAYAYAAPTLAPAPAPAHANAPLPPAFPPPCPPPPAHPPPPVYVANPLAAAHAPSPHADPHGLHAQQGIHSPQGLVAYYLQEADRLRLAAAQVCVQYGLPLPPSPPPVAQQPPAPCETEQPPPPLGKKRKRGNQGCKPGTTPPGFVKLMTVTSPLLAQVLDHADATQPLKRQEIVHGVMRYIKRHSLQLPANKKYIDLAPREDDPPERAAAVATLRELFGAEAADSGQLTFFNMQTLLKPLMADYVPPPQPPQPPPAVEEPTEAAETTEATEPVADAAE